MPHRVRRPGAGRYRRRCPAARHIVVVVVGDGEVGAAVAVEVARHEVQGATPPRKSTWGWKVPSPLPSSTDTSLSP